MNRFVRSLFGLGLSLVLLLTVYAGAQTSTAAPDPLVQVLVNKGVLTAEEASSVSTGPAAEQRDKLAAMLRDKGVISAAEFETLRTPAKQPVEPLVASVAPMLPPATAQKTEAAKPAAPPAPAVIPAIAPIRVLQFGASKPGGLVPDLKLGSGAKLKLYGFFKASAVYDTSVGQTGFANDFPLPGFLGDTGPRGAPEFHIKARAMRVGTNFEWPDLAGSKAALTGRLEFDFEGNFTRVNNRSISSIRSSVPSLRLAWARIDYPLSDSTNWWVLFGQDWTPFGSSTLPNLVETTGLGISFGSLYTREPQIRTGFLHSFGGSRSFKFGPEFAVTMPAFGNTPGGAKANEQFAYGERQGADRQRPGLEGRLVWEFQLDKAKGVAPAQIIASGMGRWRRSIVLAADVPADVKATGAFTAGAEAESDSWGYSGEIQLPTRFVTLLAKYWRGTDLRWYFSGELFSHYNNTLGAAGVLTAPSIDASDTVAFVPSGTTFVVAPQRGVRAQGGFVNLGFPLSRIANADPKGRNAGWTMYLHYGYDSAFANDVRKAGAPNGRAKSDLAAFNIQYKLNSYVTFAPELSYYRTRTIGAGSLFQGTAQKNWHDLRTEFATIFTF